MIAEEEYNEGEVLTGAELYFYLLRQNEEQLERAQVKLEEYGALKATLQVLTERSRRRALAPVAGGLAYFPAELDATNTILVLLGDNWFAERSAVQASEIAGRRLDFLRREVEVLQQEQSSLRAKQELFLSELPEAQDAVAELLAEKEAQRAGRVDSAAPASGSATMKPPETAPYAAPPQAPDAVCAVDASSKAPVTEAVPPQPLRQEPSGLSPSAAIAMSDSGITEQQRELNYAAVDAALATFDEEDDLTEDELIALEKELGDRLDDDAYVEQVMTERMIAKKERRVRAELQRREAAALAASQAAAAAATPAAAGASPSSTASAIEGGAPVKQVVAAPDTLPAAFRTPADIGGGHVQDPAVVSPMRSAMKHADPVATSFSPSLADASAAASPTALTSSSSGRKAKHVAFHESEAATEEASGNAARRAFAGQPAELPLSNATASTEDELTTAGEPPQPPLLRSTYRVGDIVEHAVEQHAAAAAASSLSPLPMQRQKPKRKSLFMQDLEGDGA